MVIKTYIDKCNTIIKDSYLNAGINPVAELNYGKNVSRVICHFPIDKVKTLIDDKTCPDITKFQHILHFTNAGSIDFSQLHCTYPSSIDNNDKIRSSSFDLIFFLLPQNFDGGKGFDMETSYFNQGYYDKYCPSVFSDSYKLTSIDGSNWYQAKNGYEWSNSAITNNYYGKTSDGIYSTERLSKEYDLFSSNSGSTIIIGRQHFDVGNENISLDITDTFNKFINGDLCNYGIGIAYSPSLEMTSGTVDNYMGLFTHKTNTFFEPFVESIYNDNINDDRSNFALNKPNKLYLYCNIGGNPQNLDQLPTCNINNTPYDVKQETKGVYYINITLNKGDFNPSTMFYDTWGNIICKGIKQDDVELYFTLKEPSIYFNIGNDSNSSSDRYIPNISGIKSNEHINRSNSEIRKLIIDARIPYTKKTSALVENMKIRLYVMDGMSELTVIDWDNVNKSYMENFYYLRLCDLLPQEYHIDVSLDYNGEHIVHKDILYFTINNDKTNKYF